MNIVKSCFLFIIADGLNEFFRYLQLSNFTSISMSTDVLCFILLAMLLKKRGSAKDEGKKFGKIVTLT